jgi:hypothetical protein
VAVDEADAAHGRGDAGAAGSELGRDVRSVRAGIADEDDSVPVRELAGFGGYGDRVDVDVDEPHIFVFARVLHAAVSKDSILERFSRAVVLILDGA